MVEEVVSRKELRMRKRIALKGLVQRKPFSSNSDAPVISSASGSYSPSSTKEALLMASVCNAFRCNLCRVPRGCTFVTFLAGFSLTIWGAGSGLAEQEAGRFDG